jgi:hypothetical protein
MEIKLTHHTGWTGNYLFGELVIDDVSINIGKNGLNRTEAGNLAG